MQVKRTRLTKNILPTIRENKNTPKKMLISKEKSTISSRMIWMGLNNKLTLKSKFSTQTWTPASIRGS